MNNMYAPCLVTHSVQMCHIYQGMSDEWVLWLNRAEIYPHQPRLGVMGGLVI